MINIEQFKSGFIDEANDLITNIEMSLLSLESQENSEELINEIFRVMHSLKGTSGMYGLHQIAEFTHLLENLYDLVRQHLIPIDNQLITLTLACIDHIRNLLFNQITDNENIMMHHSTLIAEICSWVDKYKPEDDEADEHPIVKTTTAKNENILKTYYILFQPDADIAERGINLNAIFEELKEVGEYKLIIHSQTDSAKKFYLFWEIFLASDVILTKINEIFIFVEDEIKIQSLADGNLLKNQLFVEKIDDITAENDTKSNSQKLFTISELQNVIEHLNQPKTLTQPKTNTTSEQTQNEALQQITTLKVAAGKLDELMNLVSELVTAQAELSLFSKLEKNQRLSSIAETIEKISKRLSENSFSVRLVSISDMLTRFRRLVRDLSQELEKEVAFITEGADTELDKTLIVALQEPLMHIIRNSVDHGIEKPAERVQKGKLRQGTIMFKAYYSGANVVIKINDDGNGINLNRVKDTAIRKSLISSDIPISNKDLLSLIFFPGFTTSENVSEVSGRGVGMDVVKRKLAEVRGDIDVETAENVGTTITITLPMTLSIVDSLLTKIDDSFFLIPISVVASCNEITTDQLEMASNNRIVIDGEMGSPYKAVLK